MPAIVLDFLDTVTLEKEVSFSAMFLLFFGGEVFKTFFFTNFILRSSYYPISLLLGIFRTNLFQHPMTR